MTLTGVRHRYTQGTDRLISQTEHDPRFCFELFRQAILQLNELAGEFVYAQDRTLVALWIEQLPRLPIRGEEAQFSLNRAFEKL